MHDATIKRNDETGRMEPIFTTAPKQPGGPDAQSATTPSATITPWSEAKTNQTSANNAGRKGPRIRESSNSREQVSLRHLDCSKIANQVIMAQRLSRQEEKNLHFIIQRYRLLCNRIVEVARNLGSQVFLMTSALAEEGKTLTTSN